MLGISLPSYTHTSVPSGFLMLLGAKSFHLSGKWLSNMFGGSTTWSSTLTRIRSSSCMWTPSLLTLTSGYSPPDGGQTRADSGRSRRVVRRSRRPGQPAGSCPRAEGRRPGSAGRGGAAQRHRVLRGGDGGRQAGRAVPPDQLAPEGRRACVQRRRRRCVGGRRRRGGRGAP